MSRHRAAGRDRGQAGLTLVELMIAMVILGVVIAAAFGVSYSVMNGYREHRRAMGVERSARGALSLLSDAIRNASPGVATGEITDLVGCETAWQGIHVEDDIGGEGPDALDIIYASGGIVTSLRATLTETSTEILVEDGSGLSAGDQVLVVDFDRGHLFAIENVRQNGDDWVLELRGEAQALCTPAPAPFSYDQRTIVVKAQKARFEVYSGGGVPVLQMDPDGAGDALPEPLAEGIEDLQIAVAVDLDGDGTIDEVGAAGDDDDWVYNHAGDTSMPDPSTTPYRALRVTVVARSVDDVSTAPVSLRPAAENHAGASEADPFRRRILSTIVEIRNMQEGSR